MADLDIDNVEVFETQGTITVRIANGDRRPMVIDGSSFHLFLDGAKVGRGLSNERLEVGPLSTATLEVPLFVSNLRLASRVYALMQDRRDVDYRIKSKLWLDGPVGTRKIRLEHQGRFDLDRE